MRKALFFLLTLLSFYLESQTYKLQSFNVKSGLMDNEVFNAFFDKKGFLWFYTNRSLCVYDGKKVTIFPTTIYDVGEGTDGFIYATGNKTLSKFNSLKEVQKIDVSSIPLQFYYKEVNAFKSSDEYIDKDGTAYFYFSSLKEKQDSITLYYNGKFKAISLEKELKGGFEPKVLFDNTKKMWFCFTNQKTHEYKLSYFEKGELHAYQNIGLGEEPISIYSGKKDEIFVFTEKTLFRINGSKTEKLKIPADILSTFIDPPGNKCQDSKGNLWLPYEKGLVKIEGNKIYLIVDNNPRAIACDTINEPVFDEKGNESIYKHWMCDARVFANGIAVDENDRIYTGNKVYENGKFSEVFYTNRELVIYKIFTDSEKNIWYSTSNGLFKYTLIPVRNLTLTDKIRGEILKVDKENTVYSKVVSKTGHYGVARFNILVYKFNKDAGKHLLHDSLPVEPDQTVDFNDRFISLYPSNGSILIVSESAIHVYDGKSYVKTDLNGLKFSQAKIQDKLKGKKQIIRSYIFTDSENYVWIYYNGNYIKTNGKEFKFYGKECGIKDTLNQNEKQWFSTSSNILFCDNNFYTLTNDKFKAFSYKQNGIPDAVVRTTVFGNNTTTYFLFDSIASADKKSGFVAFNGSSFTKYTIKNSDNLYITPRSFIKYKDFYFSDWGTKGLVKAEINDKDKTITLNKLKISEVYLGDFGRSLISKDKLFLFSAWGAMAIFPFDTINKVLLEPTVLHDYCTFYAQPYLIGDNIYAENAGSLGEHDTWLLKFDASGNFHNSQKPQTSIISLSFEDDGTTKEIFDDFEKTELPYHFNPFKINFKGICMTDGSKVKYKYFLEGLDEKWNEIAEDNVIYSSLSPGTYTFKVLACNNQGIWNDVPAQFTFTVLPPWNRTWWAYCMYIFAGFAAIRGYLKNRTKKLEKEKEKLEKTVKERTVEVTLQKHLLEEKQKEIIDSITYAKRIQRSLMPTDKYIARILGKKK